MHERFLNFQICGSSRGYRILFTLYSTTPLCCNSIVVVAVLSRNRCSYPVFSVKKGGGKFERFREKMLQKMFSEKRVSFLKPQTRVLISNSES